MPGTPKPKLIILYPKEKRPEKFEAVKKYLPELLEHLGKLPKANGLEDQAAEQLGDFYSCWGTFRRRVLKCDGQAWLVQNVYETEAWKNYDKLKKASTKYRTWKAADNKRRWAETSEQDKQTRRKKQREALKAKRAAEGEQVWFDLDRCFGLAERCLKHSREATSVVYGPVITLIQKHVTQETQERWMLDRVAVAIQCLRFDATKEAVARLDWAIKYAGIPEEHQQRWRDRAQLCHENSKEDASTFQGMLDDV